MTRIEPYLSRLYRYAFSLAREEDAAKELVQQCVVKALAAKSVPEDEPAYRSWLFVIVRNAFIDRVRRDKTSDAIFDFDADDPLPMEYWKGDERLINIINVKQAMSRLKTGDREIIALIDLSGLSYAEAAEVLDVPRGTVMSRISRARARLLGLLADSNVARLPKRQEA
jgi:RNA polymerase sigma-70 factor (ECF subfamily)